MRYYMILIAIFIAGCSPDVGVSCSAVSDASTDAGLPSTELALIAAIDAWTYDPAQPNVYDNVTFRLERLDGRQFSYDKGDPNERYAGHSTSKPVTMRVVLDLIDQGLFDIHDRVVDLLPGYACSQEQCRTEVHHLLGFQSSFLGGTKCWRDAAHPNPDGSWISDEFLACVNNLNNEPANDPSYPNGIPKYIGQNLDALTAIAQVQLGATIGAGDPVAWDVPDSISGGPGGPDGDCGTAGDNEVSAWAYFQCRTGLFMSTSDGTAEWDRSTVRAPTGSYVLHYTADEYLAFVRSVRDCTGWQSRRLCVMMQNDQLSHTTTRSHAYYVELPDGEYSREDWHCGYLFWHECQSEDFDCVRPTRVSTIGIGGQYAVIDHELGVIFVASNPLPYPGHGALVGPLLYRSIHDDVAAWANE